MDLDDLKDAIVFCVVAGLFLACAGFGLFGAIAGISVVNANWNCNSYEAVAQTKVMAGECYVKDGDRWIIFHSYITRHNIDVKEKP